MTKEEIRIFEALFKGVSTRFGLLAIEKYIENPDFLFCHSFQNLRLGGVKLQPNPAWESLAFFPGVANIVASKKVALSGLGRNLTRTWHENRR